MSKFEILQFYLSTTCHTDKCDTEMERHCGAIGKQQTDHSHWDHQASKCNTSQTEPSVAPVDYDHGNPSAPLAVVATIDLTADFQDSEVFIGGEGPIPPRQWDDTLPVFLFTEEVICVVISTSTPVLRNDADCAVQSSGSTNPVPLSVIQFSLQQMMSSVLPPPHLVLSWRTVGEHIVYQCFDADCVHLTAEIQLHRVNVIEEMISHFKDVLILSSSHS